MERLPDISDLPDIGQAKQANLDAINSYRDAAVEERQIAREIAVHLMLNSGMPITALSEALNVSRPTLYTWKRELAPPEDDTGG